MDRPSSHRSDQSPSPQAPFVGREGELRALQAALESAVAGRGQIVLISGEPGIGKTRTSDVFADAAEAGGARVLWGRCHEWEGAPPYWPWIQILRGYLGSVDDATLTQQLGEGAPEVAQLLPELRQRLSQSRQPAEQEPEQARFRLFEAVVALLVEASRSQSIVVVLDDIHWADTPSLLLLQFIGQSMRSSRILLVGTYREYEVQQRQSLAIALGELAREQHTRRIGLRGLSSEDVGAFVSQMSGVTPSDALVTAVHAETDGNPFFVGEVTRLLADEGRLNDHFQPPLRRVPDSVREVIRRRLDRLPAGCNRILSIGAVIGREFTLPLLARVSGEIPGALLDMLEPAVDAQLVQETPAIGTYRFSHALVQDTLYEELGTSRRMRLHAQAGQALEEIHAGDLAPYYADLTYHFIQAAPAGFPDKALDYAIRAAERSTAQLAWETAVTQYEMALQALDLQATPDPVERCNVLLALGEARNLVAAGRPRTGTVMSIGAGGSPGGRDTYWRAAEIAQQANLPEHLARAALGVVGFNPNAHQGGVEGLELLGTALDLLPETDSPLRAQLLARLGVDSYMLTFHGKLPATFELAEQIRCSNDAALSMARRLNHAPSLAYALIMRSLQAALYQAHERLAITEEIVNIAETTGDLQALSWGLVMQEYALEQLGYMARANLVLERRLLVAEQLRMPYFRWYAAIGVIAKALRAGNFPDAEQWIGVASAIQPQSGAVTAQLITMRREQAQIDGLMELVDRQRGSIPDAPYVRALRIVCQLESGEVEAAREGFEQIAADGFTNPFLTLRTLSWLAEACAAFGDVERAELLARRLSPHAGENVITGSTDLTGGSVAYYLGLLARTRSRWDEAEKYFAEALALNERWGIRPYVAHTAYAWADMLVRSGRPGGQARARDLLDGALAIAGDIGMARLAGKIQMLSDHLDRVQRAAAPQRVAQSLSPRELDVLRLIASGYSDRSIAEDLAISPRTVTTHVTHILNKLGANSRTEAAMIAVQSGIL